MRGLERGVVGTKRLLEGVGAASVTASRREKSESGNAKLVHCENNREIDGGEEEPPLFFVRQCFEMAINC